MQHFLSNTITEHKEYLSARISSYPKAVCKERGEVKIGKVNLILFAIIFVILILLILKEDAGNDVASTAAIYQTQVLMNGAPEANAEEAKASEPNVPSSFPVKERAAYPEKTHPKPHNHVVKQSASSDSDIDSVEHTKPAQAFNPQAEPDVESSFQHATTKILMFNIWSVSELRLRRAYSTYMNDSNVSSMQLEARKKEYLSFAAARTRKCGELDNKFTSNINTVEKISFDKGDVALLECHSQVNNAELEKLN